MIYQQAFPVLPHAGKACPTHPSTRNQSESPPPEAHPVRTRAALHDYGRKARPDWEPADWPAEEQQGEGGAGPHLNKKAASHPSPLSCNMEPGRARGRGAWAARGCWLLGPPSSSGGTLSPSGGSTGFNTCPISASWIYSRWCYCRKGLKLWVRPREWAEQKDSK